MLKLPGLQLRVAIDLRVGAKVSRHAILNAQLKRTLASLKFPSSLEPTYLFRSDGKRPDGITLVLWERVRQLIWGITDVDALATNLLGAGSKFNTVTTASDAEDNKCTNNRQLVHDGYVF